jgi:hypothetical protein
MCCVDRVEWEVPAQALTDCGIHRSCATFSGPAWSLSQVIASSLGCICRGRTTTICCCSPLAHGLALLRRLVSDDGYADCLLHGSECE